MDSLIYLRIKDLCIKNGITINKLESELGMSQYSIGRWKYGASPTIDKISKIAKYFNVSIDYLAGATDICAPINTIMQDHDLISILQARERMPDHDKARMMAILKIVFEDAFSNCNADESNEPQTI